MTGYMIGRQGRSESDSHQVKLDTIQKSERCLLRAVRCLVGAICCLLSAECCIVWKVRFLVKGDSHYYNSETTQKFH